MARGLWLAVLLHFQRFIKPISVEKFIRRLLGSIIACVECAFFRRRELDNFYSK